jgi:hypothetical protein
MVEDTDIVLVAVMKDPRDMEIARVLGWYRIPLRHAPKMPDVDCLAFYQTGRFGEERWAVRHAARVRGHELVTRAELLAEEADHPRAHEEYYKMLLGPLEPLARPIPSRRWRRSPSSAPPVNGFSQRRRSTNGDQTRERELLWRALRRRRLRGRCPHAARHEGSTWRSCAPAAPGRARRRTATPPAGARGNNL